MLDHTKELYENSWISDRKEKKESQLLLCPMCNKTLKSEAKYCSACGQDLDYDAVKADQRLQGILVNLKTWYHEKLEIDLDFSIFDIPRKRPKGFDIPIYDHGIFSIPDLVSQIRTVYSRVEIEVNISEFYRFRPEGAPSLVLAREHQSPDESTLGHSAEYACRQNDKTFMTLRQRCITDTRPYYDSHVHLDYDSTTLCPLNRHKDDSSKILAYRKSTFTNYKIDIMEFSYKGRSNSAGVREVIPVPLKKVQNQTA